MIDEQPELGVRNADVGLTRARNRLISYDSHNQLNMSNVVRESVTREPPQYTLRTIGQYADSALLSHDMLSFQCCIISSWVLERSK
jgi:hypothetical protein